MTQMFYIILMNHRRWSSTAQHIADVHAVRRHDDGRAQLEVPATVPVLLILSKQHSPVLVVIYDTIGQWSDLHNEGSKSSLLMMPVHRQFQSFYVVLSVSLSRLTTWVVV